MIYFQMKDMIYMYRNGIGSRCFTSPVFIALLLIFVCWSGLPFLSSEEHREAAVPCMEVGDGMEAVYDSATPIPASHSSSKRAGTPPVLFWTLEEQYENNGVHPSSGVFSDDFVFRVMYTDDDNDHPRAEDGGFIQLILDDEIWPEPMTTVDEYFRDGSIFTVTVHGLTVGTHHYYFNCSDGDHTTRFPDSPMGLPVINSAPTLMVPFLPSTGGNARGGAVFPLVANTTDEFTFQIIYTDEEDHPPSTEKGSRGVYIDGIFYEMLPQEGVGLYYDGNYSNGEMFELTTSLPRGDSHSYYFEFTDELGAVNYSSYFEGPVVLEGFPDLRIASFEGKHLITGSPVTSSYGDWYRMIVSAEIENPSDFSVNKPFRVDFDIYQADRVTGDHSRVSSKFVRVDHLYGKTRNVVSTSFIALDMGHYKAIVTVDGDSDIIEIVDNNDVRTNNKGTGFFTVGPDLVISSKDIYPSSAYARQTVFITAKIFNIGKTTAPFGSGLGDPILEVHFDVGGETYMDYIDEPILPGGFVVAKVEGFRATDPEDFVITVRIDEKDEVEEAADYGTFDNNNYNFKKLTIVENDSETASPSFSPPLFAVLILLLLISTLNWRGKRD